MIRFSVCGAASYALGELLRLMVNHPETQVAHLADSFAAGRMSTPLWLASTTRRFSPWTTPPWI